MHNPLTSTEVTLLNAARALLIERKSFRFDAEASEVRIAIEAEHAEEAIFAYLNTYSAYSDNATLTYEELHGRPEPELEQEPEGVTVLTVYDLEAGEAPRPIGVYVSGDENVVSYLAPDGTIRTAPEDCVRIVAVQA